MNRTLYWKKGIFKCVYKIYNAGKYVGKLIENPWSQSARGDLNDKSLLFTVKNALMPKIVIEEPDSRQVVGKIKSRNKWDFHL